MKRNGEESGGIGQLNKRHKKQKKDKNKKDHNEYKYTPFVPPTSIQETPKVKDKKMPDYMQAENKRPSSKQVSISD